jgi:hypothetical protein
LSPELIIALVLQGIGLVWLEIISRNKGDDEFIWSITVFFYVFENWRDTWKPAIFLFSGVALLLVEIFGSG